MELTLRALLIVLAMTLPVVAWAQWGLRGGIDPDALRRRGLAWVIVTVAAFTVPGFWLFVLVLTAVCWHLSRTESHLLPSFVVLLFVMPPFPVTVGGLGVLQQLAEFNYVRVLALLLLLPQWLRSRRAMPGPLTPVDLCVFGFAALQLVLQLRGDTLTNTMRYGFYAGVDVLLPYLVARQSMANARTQRDVLVSMLWAAALLSSVAVFEWGKHWLLYREIPDHMGYLWFMGGYLLRNESLRASASTGHALVLGFVLAVAIGLAASTTQLLSLRHRVVLLGLLGAGLFATLSRGPWLGGALAVVVAVLAGAYPFKRGLRLVLALLPVVAALALSPFGDTLLDLLPFVGNVDEFNVIYRRRLLEVSLQVISYNPWFGAFDFLEAAEMQQMMQGEGIIDIVNTYVAVALAQGLVGLALFGGALFFAALGVWKHLRRTQPLGWPRDAGRALLAALAAAVLILGTTSSINNITIVMWLLVGWCAGYARHAEAAWAKTARGSVPTRPMRPSLKPIHP